MNFFSKININASYNFLRNDSSSKKLESEPDYNQGLIKASTKQYKVFPKVDICLLVDGMLQKNSEDMYLDTVFLTYSDCCLKYIICVLICFQLVRMLL